jgi:hypothetical protein
MMVRSIVEIFQKLFPREGSRFALVDMLEEARAMQAEGYRLEV